MDSTEKRAATHAILTEGGVASPAGRIILVRQGEALCAIRFVSASRDHDQQPSTAFNTGSETMRAEYEWHYEERASSGFSAARQSGRGSASRGPIYGIGRLIIPSTRARIDCGSIDRMGWQYPYLIYVDDNEKGPTLRRKFAPTAWQDVKAVNLADPKLVWYSFSFDRKARIPLTELPGS